MLLPLYDNLFILICKELLFYLDYLSTMFYLSEAFFLFSFIFITLMAKLFVTNSLLESVYVSTNSLNETSVNPKLHTVNSHNTLFTYLKFTNLLRGIV